MYKSSFYKLLTDAFEIPPRPNAEVAPQVSLWEDALRHKPSLPTGFAKVSSNKKFGFVVE